MALSPEFRPQGPSSYRPQITPKEKSAQISSLAANAQPSVASSRAWKDRSDTNANSAMPYIFVVIALVAISYVSYAYYWPVVSLGEATNQSIETKRPAIVFTQEEAAPATSAATIPPAFTLTP